MRSLPSRATPARGLAEALWGARLYARTRRAPGVLLACGIALVLLGVGRSATLHVPFAPELVVVEAFLVGPVLPVVLLGGTLGAPLAALEDVMSERMTRLRAGHLGLLLVVLTATTLVISGLRAAEALAVGRNAALLLGLLLVTAAFVDVQLAWLGPVLPTALCFFFGKRQDDGSVHTWALLLRPADRMSMVLAVGVLAAGAALFVWRGPRRVG